jgi:ATP-dependent DNA ligase
LAPKFDPRATVQIDVQTWVLACFNPNGDDLRDLPLIERKRRLARLIGKAKRRAIRFTEHLTGDGPIVFEHVCSLGLEGIVSKRTDAPYRSGRSRVWLKSKNPASEAVRRESEAEWRWTRPAFHPGSRSPRLGELPTRGQGG